MLRASLLLATLLLFAAPATLPGQGAADPLTSQQPDAVHVDRLFVKLAEGTGAELRDGRLVSRTGIDLAPVARWFAAAAAEPLVTALTWDELDALYRQAAAALPAGRRPGHLGLWFRLRAPSAPAAAELLAALAAEPLVSSVYFEPRLHPAAAAIPQGGPAPPTPSFTALQFAHLAAPVGHGARFAAGIYGGRGQGIGLRMLEDNWVVGHEDVSQLVSANCIGGLPPFGVFSANHGLSGASIVLADRNGFGINGIAERMTPRFVSFEVHGSLENSIAVALANSQPGDVFLLVYMITVPALGPGTWLPVEFYQSAFDATLTATASGRHFVAAAGNGNRSLDDPALLGRFDLNNRDSGAILVAASVGVPLQRASFSNWGSRIDAHSFGGDSVTCGYGTLFQPAPGYLRAYTDMATGTSTSTPHIAAVIGSIAGAVRQQLGGSLTPLQIRGLLRSHGPTTPDVIGRRPDLAAIFAALGVVDGLRLGTPDVEIGAAADVLMDGPDGGFAGLLASFAPGDIDVGLNRRLHLDPAGLVPIGVHLLSGGAATWQFPVPNQAALRGVDVYLQAVRGAGDGSLSLTSSCHLTIL